MYLSNLSKIMIAVVATLAIIALGAGMQSIAKENNAIRDNCAPTEMYVIGNKGTATRVYDCGDLKEAE